MRARHQGKPVVLIDPNRIHNAILAGLVAPETHVHSIEEACKRLRELAAEFNHPFMVRKRDGSEQAFSTKKVVQSVSLAAAAAGVTDAALEEQISGPVIVRLRREGGRHGLLQTSEVRQALFERLGWMSADPGQPIEIRTRTQAILDAWEKREARKEAERGAIDLEKAHRRVDRRAGRATARNWKPVTPASESWNVTLRLRSSLLRPICPPRSDEPRRSSPAASSSTPAPWRAPRSPPTKTWTAPGRLYSFSVAAPRSAGWR